MKHETALQSLPISIRILDFNVCRTRDRCHYHFNLQEENHRQHLHHHNQEGIIVLLIIFKGDHRRHYCHEEGDDCHGHHF